MATAEESVANHSASQLASALARGIDTISQGQDILFHRYRRTVLPADGFVFWVREEILAQPTGAPNKSGPNSFLLNGGAYTIAPDPTTGLSVRPASLHHTTLNQQDEAESFSLQTFTLTCQQSVDQLASISPDELWIGEFGPYRLAFSSRSGYYLAANVFHYKGDALYPALASQVIDFPQQLPSGQLVSNSLPVWLGLNLLQAPIAPAPGPAPPFKLYPSFLVPDNVTPPYAAVHIGEDDTTPLAAGPFYDPSTGSRYQWVKDHVRITFYGVPNDQIMDFLDLVERFVEWNPAVMGIMNTPTVKDAKRGQTEFSIIAQKKVVTYDVNYYQAALRSMALQLITSAFISVGLPAPANVPLGTNYVGYPQAEAPTEPVP